MAALGTTSLFDLPRDGPKRGASFNWSTKSPPIIGDHSRTKLTVYSEYIRRYILERVSLQMDRFSINIVDGFCGGGHFLNATGDDVAGSPLIILEAVEAARKEIAIDRRKPLTINLRLYCFDADHNAIDKLRSALIACGYGAELDRTIFLERAVFSQRVRRLVAELERRPGRTIFLLDQLGYGQVSFDALRLIFEKLNKPEIILTFAYEWLTAFVSSYKNLYKQLDRLAVRAPTEQAYNDALGGPHGASRFIQSYLIGEFRETASYFTPFFITSRNTSGAKGSNLKYWLVHLADHERANDVMKQVHWALSNHSAHFGGAGLDMLGYDPYKRGDSTAYLFGASDSERTESALMDDLPRLLRRQDKWITAASIWEQTCNETPSTSDMQAKILKILGDSKELEIIGALGGAKRGGEIVKQDQIRLALQPSFYFMKT